MLGRRSLPWSVMPLFSLSAIRAEQRALARSLPMEQG
jgi:hypothetical protein